MKRYNKIYKKNGVYCEDICDELDAKKENEEFENVKLQNGEFGLFKKPKIKGKKKSKAKRGMYRGNKEVVKKENMWIVSVMLLIFIFIMIIIYIRI